MKNIILILVISFLTTSFTVEKEQPTGDDSTYHVMALSGLKMRNEPTLKGEKLLTIPYNGAVEVIATGFGEFKVKELEDFYIEGEWVQVSYDGKEGYVFSGYLTQFTLPDLDMSYDYERASSRFEYFFDTKFTLKGEKYNILKVDWECNTEAECTCGYSKEYKEGIFYSYKNCNEGNGSYEIEIEGITMAEAYFIMLALDLNEEKKHGDVGMIRKYDKNQKTISEDPEGVGCWTDFRQRKMNSIIFDMTCGC